MNPLNQSGANLLKPIGTWSVASLAHLRVSTLTIDPFNFDFPFFPHCYFFGFDTQFNT